jgi:tRNA threonylcarbamoyladenosine biosynthesis protein TsaB
MALILSLESSTTVCSAALHRDGELLSYEFTEIPNSAASQLAVMIDNVLKKAGVTTKQLEAAAVCSGPGSYTGLRIAVATAKGICYALRLPLIAVSSLEVMAMQVNESNSTGELLCPMIDARRMEVYTMLLDAKLNVVEPITASIIDAGSYTNVLAKQQVFFFGNGSDKVKEILTHPNAHFVGGVFPSAKWLGVAAHLAFGKNKFEDVGEFEPMYLKDFIAKKPKSLV